MNLLWYTSQHRFFCPLGESSRSNKSGCFLPRGLNNLAIRSDAASADLRFRLFAGGGTPSSRFIIFRLFCAAAFFIISYGVQAPVGGFLLDSLASAASEMWSNRPNGAHLRFPPFLGILRFRARFDHWFMK